MDPYWSLESSSIKTENFFFLMEYMKPFKILEIAESSLLLNVSTVFVAFIEAQSQTKSLQDIYVFGPIYFFLQL
jgi:hypothetical protein